MEKLRSLSESMSGCDSKQACSAPIMRSYIGAKIIKAMPMTDLDFETEKGLVEDAKRTVKAYQRGENLMSRLGGGCCSSEPREVRQGYKVMYPDGYTSWSPKNVFEQAYRLISKEESVLI